MRALILLAIALGPGLGSMGCALTSRGETLDIRWFSPEPAIPRLTSGASPAERPEAGLALELGRVRSGLHLRDKIAYRDSSFELGYYEDRRWTERPEVFVRRDLARTLFEERGLERAFGGPVRVLDVEVLAFEEIRGPAPAARVSLRMVLHDHRRAVLERTITVDRPVTGADRSAASVVQAMALALDEAVEQVVDAAVKELLRSASATRGAPP